jgi:hypothetical protein
LTGTPTAEGSYQFVVRAQHATPIAEEAFTLSVRQPLVVRSPFTPTPRPSAEVGIRFGKSATATGGSGTYSWSLSSLALPAGLALDVKTGTISGIPQAAGNFAFGLTATDTEGRETTVSGALAVAPRLAIRTLRLKPANVGRVYRAKLATAGGVAPMRWRVVSGKLPAGFRLSQSLGTFVGTPRRAGTFTGVVEARDALGAKARQRLALQVKP